MPTAWYNSQILGVIVGAVLGFIFSYVPKKIEECHSRRAFRRVLKSELEQVTLRLMHHRNICVNCWNEIANHKLDPSNTMNYMNHWLLYTTDYPTNIFKANVDKLAIFSDDVIKKLFAFYASAEDCRQRMIELERDNPSRPYVSEKMITVGTPKYPDALKKAQTVLGGAVQKGEELIENVKKEISEEWQMPHALNELYRNIASIFKRKQ